MAKQAQPGRWHRFRVVFRRCRITVLLVVLALVAGLLYLNVVGLPGFIKSPVLNKLHARGLDVRFTRLRWGPFHGLVAEDVFFGRTNDVGSPKLTAKEMVLDVDYRALLRWQIQVESLFLSKGRMAWPVVVSNEPPREMSVENIHTELRLLTNDVWQLDNLQAELAGAKVQLSGSITNASVVREWPFFRGVRPTQPEALQERIRRIANIMEKIHFATPPEFKLDLRGDARDMEKMAVRMSLEAPDADTPWGKLDHAKWSVLMAPPPGKEYSRAEVKLSAASAVTPWTTVTNLLLTSYISLSSENTNLVHVDLELTAEAPQTKSNRSDTIHFTAQWLHSLTNAIPLSGHGELQLSNVLTGWGSARQLNLTATLLPSTNTPQPDASWAWWTNLAPYAFDLECQASGVRSPKLDADEIFCSAQWRAPDLSVEKLDAKLYNGTLDAKANLNVATRELAFSIGSDFDPHKVELLLTPGGREWLANYSWNNPPQVKGEGALLFPSWTDRHLDWQGEVRPTLRLNGQFHVVDAAFRGLRALTAESHFSYSNMTWTLPDLVATRPEGRINLFHRSDDRTKDYYFNVHSTIDPRVARVLVATNQQRGFDLFGLTEPPVVDGEVWGRWHAPEQIRARAHVTVTNFAVRGETAEWFQSDLVYTNRILKLVEPRVQQAGTQQLAAATVTVSFDQRKIFVTNGFSTADPMPVARAIGPHVTHAIEPYRFTRPPIVHVEGAIPMRDPQDADLHFQVTGGLLDWYRFQVTRITGKVDWVGLRLSLSDIRADFYLGKATGEAQFDFQKKGEGADFKFNLVSTDADLHLLAKDLQAGTPNKLEGMLTTRIEITNANTTDWKSWQGVGRVNLRDGLIWDIPIFGIFSPVLDTIMPGLGSSRARDGIATFTVTNGVVYSDDLKIETLMARLRYWGTVDLKGNVNAKMETELLRNTWVLGPVLSLALWPVSKTFEYQITGTVHAPKSDPVFVPKIFFFPLHPMQTIREIKEETNSSTNAPPAPPPQARD